MPIQKKDGWWVGTSPNDIQEYLSAYSEDSYPVGQVIISKCQECDSEEFAIDFDGIEGAARLTCRTCEKVKFLADSQEMWEAAEPESFLCMCKNTYANVGTGFSYRETGEARWVYIGVRRSECGLLGSVADWEIDYAPTTEMEMNV